MQLAIPDSGITIYITHMYAILTYRCICGTCMYGCWISRYWYSYVGNTYCLLEIAGGSRKVPRGSRDTSVGTRTFYFSREVCDMYPYLAMYD